MKLIEQALRQVVSQYLDQVDEQVRRAVQEAVKKRVRGDGGIEKLTMGQMIYTLRDARFWDEWARISGKSLSSLQVIDLENLTQLRNKIIHDLAEATRTEAEFLLHGLKMMLETFDLLTFDTPTTPTPEEKPMSIAQDKPHGGTQFGSISIIGSVGKNVTTTQTDGNFTGEVIGGDKITREATTTTVTYGFQQETDKAKFLQQIEVLRGALREIKTALEAVDDLDADQKEDLAMELLQQSKDLKTVKETAEATPPGKDVPKEKADLVGKYLDKTTTLMDKLKKMGEAITGASEKILPAVLNALPLLASVRRLFGLP